MTDLQELMACPFCGCADISEGEVFAEHPNGRMTKQNMCNGCGALGPEARVTGPDYGDVESNAAWNRRSPAFAEMARDAERYRWIVSASEINDSVNFAIFMSDKEAADTAIDAQRGEAMASAEHAGAHSELQGKYYELAEEAGRYAQLAATNEIRAKAAEAARDAAIRVAEEWNAEAIADGFGGGSAKGKEILAAMLNAQRHGRGEAGK